MKITGGIGKAISKMLITENSSSVEIYEVEEWGYEVFHPDTIASYSDEFFTTLEEAEQVFKEKTKFLMDSTEYNNMQGSRDDCTHCKYIYSLRKYKVFSKSDNQQGFTIKKEIATKSTPIYMKLNK